MLIAGRRKLSERPLSSSSSNAINIPVVVSKHFDDDSESDDDDVFLTNASDKENICVGRRRQQQRRRTRKQTRSSGDCNKDTLFPSLSNHSTSRSPIRSLCVNSSPGRRELLRHGLRHHHGLPMSPSKSDSAVNTLGSRSMSKVRILGRGSFGSVVLGEWQGKRVAVKLISHDGQKAGARCRTESVVRESNAVGLSHRNIVRVHSIFCDGDNYSDAASALVVMEYVGQSNLQTLLDTMPDKIDEKFMAR